MSADQKPPQAEQDITQPIQYEPDDKTKAAADRATRGNREGISPGQDAATYTGERRDE